MKTGMTGVALAGMALAGGQAIAQAVPKTTPENLAPAPITVPLPSATQTPAPVPSSLVVVPIEASSARQEPPRALRPGREAPRAARAASEPRPVAPVVAPAPVPVPVTPPTSAPAPSVTPAAAAPVVAAPAPEPEIAAGWPGWLVPVGLGGFAALIAGFVAWRRRGAGAAEVFVEEVAAPVEPVVVPIAPKPAKSPEVVPEPPQFLERPAPSERAWLDITAPLVHRAGINLFTATADVALVVRNEGNAPARGIRLAIRLTSAQPGQDAVLDALFAEPVERPTVPPFDLAPGEERAVRGIATLPREAIVALEAAGRPMFVPVVALDTRYDAGGGSPAQTTAAFAIGVERGGGGKLGPLWLDEQARMHDAIGIRAHGTTVKR